MSKLIKVLLLIFCMFPIIIKADVCSVAKSDAEKVKTSYEFIYKDGNPTFKVTLKNISSNIIAVKPDGTECKSNCTFYTGAVASSYDVYIKIFDRNHTCSSPAKTITVKLPQYNQYSNMDVCKDIKNYKYCKEIIKENIDVHEIHDKIVDYKKALIKEDKIDTTEEEISEQFKLSDDVKIYNMDKKNSKKIEEKEKNKDYKLTIILSVVVLTLFIVVLILLFVYKKKKKKKVVEL